MKCSRVQDKLLLFQASELPAAESEQIRQHLRACVCCNAVATEVRELERVASYAVATTVTAPPGLDTRVMRAIRSAPAPSVWKKPLFLPRFSRAVYVALALLLLTSGFALGMWVANRGDQEAAWSFRPPPPCGTDGYYPGKPADAAVSDKPHPKGCLCRATPACGKSGKGGKGGKGSGNLKATRG